jgi:hypothetical protein
MTIQTINVGNIANDGTGDDLREAFIKVNNNLLYLENAAQEPAIEGNNLGGAGEGIYASKDSNTLNFKELIGGSNISLSSNNSSITINSEGGISDILVLTDEGSLTLNAPSPHVQINGGSVITTRTVPASNTVFVDLADEGVLAHDTSPRLSTKLEARGYNINNAGTVSADKFDGPLEGTVYDIDIRDINAYFDNNWDFGKIVQTRIASFLDYLVLKEDLDFGPIDDADTGFVEFDVDLGTLS